MSKKIILFLILMLSLSISTVYGKDCVPGDVESGYDDADAVFIGKVMLLNNDGTVKMKVLKNFKGAEGTYINIMPNEWESFVFKVRKNYLVFAVGNSNIGYNIPDCSHTKLYSEAKNEMKILGKMQYDEQTLY